MQKLAATEDFREKQTKKRLSHEILKMIMMNWKTLKGCFDHITYTINLKETISLNISRNFFYSSLKWVNSQQPGMFIGFSDIGVDAGENSLLSFMSIRIGYSRADTISKIFNVEE